MLNSLAPSFCGAKRQLCPANLIRQITTGGAPMVLRKARRRQAQPRLSLQERVRIEKKAYNNHDRVRDRYTGCRHASEIGCARSRGEERSIRSSSQLSRRFFAGDYLHIPAFCLPMKVGRLQTPAGSGRASGMDNAVEPTSQERLLQGDAGSIVLLYIIPTGVGKGGVGEAPTEKPTHFPNDLGMLYQLHIRGGHATRMKNHAANSF
jgi:hypothetical protein